MNIGHWVQQQAKWKIYSLATALFLLDEYLDYLSGPEMNLSFFHLVPIFLVVWNAGLIPGVLFSFLIASVMLGVGLHAGLAGPTSGQVSNALANLIFYVVFTVILNQLKKYLERVTFMAEVDGLTNLLNSRSFLQRADQEVRASAQSGRPFTVLYIDVDNFKALNDNLGHGAGDEVLISIGKILNTHFRKNDLRTRIGGDEFAVLLPDFSMEEAKVKIPKFHEKLNLSLKENKDFVTCSLGAVTFLQAPASAKEALIEADMLMYKVKLNGKNNFQLKISPSPEAGSPQPVEPTADPSRAEA